MTDWADELTEKLLDHTPELKDVSLREIMASALRAERERCAGIAEMHSKAHWGGNDAPDVVLRLTAMSIAALIKDEDE